jgi:hypothetical protein
MKTTLLTFLGFALFGSTTLFDVRAGSARTGRTIIGGGLHGGK